MCTLISLGKHLDEPCPPGFFPEEPEDHSEEAEHSRKLMEAWEKRWGQPPAFKQKSPPPDQGPPIADH